MNLNNIVGSVISAVNPWVSGVYQKSSGYTTAADGSRTPTYTASVNVSIQMQALSYQDLKQLDGLNIAGEKHAMYINGDWQSVARPDGKGGDYLTLADGTKWLIVFVLENWYGTAGWCKCAVTRQL